MECLVDPNESIKQAKMTFELQHPVRRCHKLAEGVASLGKSPGIIYSPTEITYQR